MRLLVMGLRRGEIARMLGVHPATVTNVQQSPVCQAQLSRLRARRDESAVDMTQAIKELAPEALRTLEATLSCGLPNVQLSAAKDILDRAGYTPVTKVRTENYSVHFTANEIDEIKKRAKEVGAIRPTEEETQDAEYEETPCTP